MKAWSRGWRSTPSIHSPSAPSRDQALPRSVLSWASAYSRYARSDAQRSPTLRQAGQEPFMSQHRCRHSRQQRVEESTRPQHGRSSAVRTSSSSRHTQQIIISAHLRRSATSARLRLRRTSGCWIRRRRASCRRSSLGSTYLPALELQEALAFSVRNANLPTHHQRSGRERRGRPASRL